MKKERPEALLQIGSERELEKASDHPCYQCALCCRYVALEIDEPTTMKEYDHVVWYLYHRDVSVFVDHEGAWYIKFETRCRHLTPKGLCGIYERRPAICKDFDWRECEQHVREEPPDRWLFRDAEEFLAWFRKRRPRTYQRYEAFLRKKHAGCEEPELERLTSEPPPDGLPPC